MADHLFDKEWKLDIGASAFSTEFQPNIETRKYEFAAPDGYKLTVSGTHNDKSYTWDYTCQNNDGKDYPVNGSGDVATQDVDAIEAYKVNDRITIGFFKKTGVLAGAYQRIVSADGTKLTVQAAGRHTDGTPFYNVLEYSL